MNIENNLILVKGIDKTEQIVKCVSTGEGYMISYDGVQKEYFYHN